MNDLRELDKYPWTGHSAILGRRKNVLIPQQSKTKPSSAEGGLFFPFLPEREKDNKKPRHPRNPCQVKPLSEKTIEDVLLHFGETHKVARRRYRQFVKNGIEQGKRPELQGGGLVRSAGGNKAGLLGRRREEREKGDARILGSGTFVNEALNKAGEDWKKGKNKRMPLAQLIAKVASHLDLKKETIISPSRKRRISEARGIICYLAVNDMAYSTSEVAHALDVRRVSAGQCVIRGEKILDKNRNLRDKLTN